jgi:hypothetical protein
MRVDRKRKPFVANIKAVYFFTDRKLEDPKLSFRRHDATTCHLPCRLLLRNVLVLRSVGDDYVLVYGYAPAMGRLSKYHHFLIHKEDLRLVG